MKSWSLIFSAFAVLSLAACSPDSKQDENLDGAVTIQLPTTEDGKYALTPVNVFTLKNLKKLSGIAAKFYIDPSVEGGELRGRSPDFKYIRNADNVVIPTDVLSLQLASVYSHMEKLKELDEAVGAGKVNEWPRKVAINAIYSSPGEGRLFNNALYSGQIDAMVFVPYTKQDLPVMVNAGVIGHEHFHSLFYKLVVKPLGDLYPDQETPTIHDESTHIEQMRGEAPVAEARTSNLSQVDAHFFNGIILRAMNEGLADVWGWIYSGDNDFVAKSIPEESSRKIGLPMDAITATEVLKAQISAGIRYSESHDKDFNPSWYSYSIGTQLARAIKGVTEDMTRKNEPMTKSEKQQFAKALIQSLSSIRERVAGREKGEYLSPVVVLEVLSEQLIGADMANSKICERLLGYVDSRDQKELVSCMKATATP